MSKKSETPVSRRKTGVRLLKGGHSPEIGQATQFGPGKSGNPSGRPKKVSAEEVLSEIDEINKWKSLVSSGKEDVVLRAMMYLTDRRDGKAKQSMDVNDITDDFKGWTKEDKLKFALTGEEPSWVNERP